MKRWIALLLLSAMLAGCTAAPTQKETVGNTQPVTEPTAPGLYAPESALEKQTNRALRDYPLPQRGCAGMLRMEQDILLFYTEAGSENLTVKRYAGDQLREQSSAVLETSCPESPYMRVYGDKLAYYSPKSGSIIVLDKQFQELQRSPIPDADIEAPVISADLTKAYYCTGDQIKVLDLQMGISRMIRQQENHAQTLKEICFSDSLLVSLVTDEREDTCFSFISTATGELLRSDEGAVAFYGADSGAYFLQRQEGEQTELLFGKDSGSPGVLQPEHGYTGLFPMPEAHRVLLTAEGDSGKLLLELYDLQSGQLTSGLTLGSQWELRRAILGNEENTLWLLARDINTKEEHLLLWNCAASATGEEKVYTAQRFTDDMPDTAGLIECQLRASVLSEKYGLDITVNFDRIVTPEGHILKGEYQVPALQSGLEKLDGALSKFPDGFFQSLSQVSADGRLHIGIVRSISGDKTGLHYWKDSNAHIVLAVDAALETAFCHQVSHVLDTFILSNSTKMDDWEAELNPKKFRYDYNYEDYLTRTDDTYLTGNKRYFVDAYSMTYPTEDRARILEYAMQPGNEEIFASKYMQAKLDTLCDSIRDAFGWKKDERSFLWEQYLKT